MTTAGVAGRGSYGAPARETVRVSRFNRNMLIIVGAVLAVSLFVYISRMAAVAAGSKSISALNAQIAAERSRCQQLEIVLAERRNLDMVGDEAVNRLGMIRPDAASVRVVSLPDMDGGGAQTVYDPADDTATP